MSKPIYVTKQVLNSPSKFREAIRELLPETQQRLASRCGVIFEEESLSELMLAVLRLRQNRETILKHEKNRRVLQIETFMNAVEKSLCSTVVSVPLSDPDILRLLVFCIEITHQMFEGGIRATTAAKSFREKQRRYEEILLAQFIGKLGEVLLKRYLENLFPNTNIQLDWEISPNRQKYTSDIPNAKHIVSIKSSPSLAGVWAEADIESEYGIMVKCVVPRATLLQFFIEVCGYIRLFNFIEERVPKEDALFQGYIQNIRNRVSQYRCDEVKTNLIGFVCGYFRTSEYEPTEQGQELEYLGAVREKRYLVKLSELHSLKQDWQKFLEENGLYT